MTQIKRGVPHKHSHSRRAVAEGLDPKMLALASSGDLIRELESREYLVFPKVRCQQADHGWLIMKTEWELKNNGSTLND